MLFRGVFGNDFAWVDRLIAVFLAAVGAVAPVLLLQLVEAEEADLVPTFAWVEVQFCFVEFRDT